MSAYRKIFRYLINFFYIFLVIWLTCEAVGLIDSGNADTACVIVIGISLLTAFGGMESMEFYLLGIIVQGCTLFVHAIFTQYFTELILVLIPIAYTIIVYIVRKIIDSANN